MLETIKNLPDKSGIYQYFDENLNILYIGKAKSLKKRVRSYFLINEENISPAKNLSSRIQNMVKQIRVIKIIIVNSEHDALILENSLIKSMKPKYNIILRDDKTYPYICVDKNAAFPRLEITRKIIRKKNLYFFGPYSKGIRDVIDSIYEFIPLIQKKSCLNQNKPCLFYQIKKCKAPCANLITIEKYGKFLNEAIDLLNNTSKLINMLHKKMLLLSKDLRFEEANKIKLKIEKIKAISNINSIDLARLYNFDIFTIYSKDNKSVLIKLFMREGKIISSDYQIINHNNNEVRENYLYTQGLINHYKQNPPFKLDAILLPIALDNKNEILKAISANVKILNPKNGDKKRLLDLAIKNAKNILESEIHLNLNEEIKTLLNLENIPSKIEVFDTSHHLGSSIVGGMIVYENNCFLKDEYKKFNLIGKDEYSQMEEMLERRIKHYEKTSPPDLWLLDGGKGQINIAMKIIQSSGIYIDVVAIAKEKINYKANRAKGGARDIIRTKELELRLEKSDKRLLFLQKLRDEAHRYAISFHRYKKAKSIKNDKYSPAQLKKLLNYFGTFENINNADSKTIKEILKK